MQVLLEIPDLQELLEVIAEYDLVIIDLLVAVLEVR